MPKLLIAKESFHTHDEDGLPTVVIAGQTMVYDNDDLAVRFPEAFQISERHVRPEVESATAAPGEKRGPGRPPKTAA